jgi:hypothetical protein
VKLLASICVLAVAGLSGCATSTINYEAPVEKKFTNTATVNQQFDQVWDRLVRQLSSDFFVINNIDKNSRLINLSFSAQRPSDFVDCGVTNRTFTNARGEQRFSYYVADSSEFVATDRQNIAFQFNRSTKIEGRINVYVAPVDKASTTVSVNAKYVVNGVLTATSFDGRPAGVQNFTFDISTKQPHVNDGLTCYALGTIEQKILKMVSE